jgi:hypothetical protein
MALRNQPYLPLYVQDYLTDEKLNECSAATQGVYIKLLCIMHKSKEYGCILLEQKYKQKISTCFAFASKLANHLPFNENIIFSALEELIKEGVIKIDGDKIYQSRMVKDNLISIKRSKAGKIGGDKNIFAQANIKAKGKAKVEANTEYEYDNVNENVLDNKIESNFWFLKFYHSTYESYKSVFNGKSSTPEMFAKWKKFIDFIYTNKYEEIFECKFISPHDFENLVNNSKFNDENWEPVIKSLLSTGIKPEHNLFFRIPQFMEYANKSINNSDKSAGSASRKKIEALRNY